MGKLLVIVSRTIDMVIRFLYLNFIVDDNIVIDLVKKEILKTEKEGKSWIIEGFPRTKV